MRGGYGRLSADAPVGSEQSDPHAQTDKRLQPETVEKFESVSSSAVRYGGRPPNEDVHTAYPQIIPEDTDISLWEAFRQFLCSY